MNGTVYFIGGLSGNSLNATFQSPFTRLEFTQPFSLISPPLEEILADNTPAIAFHAAVPRVANTSITVCGGIENPATSTKVRYYEITTNTWHSIPSNISVALKRYQATLTHLGTDQGIENSFYFGGIADDKTIPSLNQSIAFAGLARLSPGGNAIITIINDAYRPIVMWDHCSVALPDKKVMVLGGMSLRNNTPALVSLRVVRYYDPHTNAWSYRNVAGENPFPRRAFSAVGRIYLLSSFKNNKEEIVANNQVVIYGGASGDFSTIYNDVAVLDLTSWEWSIPKIAATVPFPVGRYGHAANMLDSDRMLISFGIIISIN